MPALTVAENLELARMGTLGGLASPEIASRVAGIAEELGWPLDLGARVDSLGVGERQRVEILKALGGQARAVLLDEPTATLAPERSRSCSASCGGSPRGAGSSSSSRTSSPR